MIFILSNHILQVQLKKGMEFNSNNFYTGGQYYKNNPDWDDRYTGWKAGIIHTLLKKNNVHPKTIVEVGCGAGGILKHLSALDKDIIDLKGYDISPDAIALASVNKTNNISFYNEDYASCSYEGADVLLCIDVIEHVDNIYGFLSMLSSKASYTVFHIPLDISCRTILKPHVIFQQRDTVGHIHYFTKEIAEWALKDCGYKIIDWVYTKPPVDWEPADSPKRAIKKMLRNLSFSLHKNISAKFWGGYSIMVLAS